MLNSESGYGTNMYEYSVKKKADKKIKAKKFAFTAGTFLIWLVATVLLFSFMKGVAIVYVPVLLLLSIIFLWFILRFTNLEYDYEIAVGDMKMSVVYGGRSRKILFKKKISEMEEIAKYDISQKDALTKNADIVYECISSFDSENVYYLRFTDNNKKHLVFFEMQKKGEKLFKFYNSSAARL